MLMNRRDVSKLKNKLTPEQYNICFLKGTEPPFSGKYTDNHESGMYHCAVCGNPLFASDTKFDSGTGWPSFWDMASPETVMTEEDSSLGIRRTEVLCSRCGAHLGHVFPDGPREKTGLRYCINSLALEFKKR
jgi:peptide-methionine (R)-S-oxide reductase